MSVNLSGDTGASICFMAGGDSELLRSMRIEGWLNEELIAQGIDDRKLYVFRNQRRKEIFWVFVFQPSQISWYRSMEMKLSSDSVESAKSIRMEKLQMEKSIGFFNFLKNERRIKKGTDEAIIKVMACVLDG